MSTYSEDFESVTLITILPASTLSTTPAFFATTQTPESPATIFSKPVAKLKKGRLLSITKCRNEWCKVKVTNFIGWVKSESLWGRL